MSTSAVRRGRRRVIGPLVVLLVAASSILLAVTVDRRASVPLAGAAAVQPALVPVARESRIRSMAVSLEIERDAGLRVLTGRGGVVTALAGRPGEVLRDGQEVARVEDRPVLAMVAPAPLYRDLGRGDRGADVTRLQRWLTTQGHDPGAADGRFGARTADAVVRFNREHGFGTSSRFSLSSVAWIGPGPLRVAAVETPVGSRTGSGGALFTGAGVARRVTVTEPGSGLAGAGDHVLVIGETRVPYTPGSEEITRPEAVSAVGEALGRTDEGVARVESTAPADVVVLPAAALVTDADGAVCVFADTTGPGVAVQPVGGGVSTVDVAPEVDLDRVLANPAQVRQDLACG